MVFSSPLFLYFFLPVFFAAYYAGPPQWRNWILLGGSLLFYTAGAGVIVVALLVSVWGNHFIAKRIAGTDRPSRGLLLGIGVALNLAGLIYYKYTPLLWDAVNHVTVWSFGFSIGARPEISLPVGISFFTFQTISYIVDVYRHDAPPALSYGHFAVYHTLFPQLVAGPIVRYREVIDRLNKRDVDLVRLSDGAYRFCLGLGKKIILADNLGRVADQLIKLPHNELTAGHAWLGIACYTLQIYYDFSGYSDMAIGLGKMLGFDFPENFDQPYRAQSVTEFWRRWHMTLTRWFRDYLYIPMGGNRRGSARTYFNLTVVFALCGLWHGASSNFLIWGLYHGVLLVSERVADRQFGLRPRGPFGVVLTLVLVMTGWVFFRIEHLGPAVGYLRAMFGFGTADTVFFPLRYFMAPDIVAYLAAGVLFALAPAEKLYWRLEHQRPLLLAGQLFVGYLIFCVSALQLAANSFNPFIYFRF
jgi:alginate O-acetyltransferase complex protein AlgI